MTSLAVLPLLFSSMVANSVVAPSKAKTIAEAWRALASAHGSACGDDLLFDYAADGGMRNFFCRALTVFSWKTFLSLAPVPPFLSGPHRASKLELNSPTSFGHYNPDFVRWVATALVPAASDPSLRRATQPTYDSQVKQLARTYEAVWRVLASHADWVEAERGVYLRAMRRGHSDWATPDFDLYHELLGKADANWNGWEPNLVRSATLFWLRRFEDETAPLWASGLEGLLGTYDPVWLRTQQNERPPAPPVRPAQSVPEYR